MKAYLILENGIVFEGTSFGVKKEIISEIVFNTSMTGYLEVLTDPSYAGQAVVMTYPLIGNYGVCYEDMESKKAWPDAFVVREEARRDSNFRTQDTLEHFLIENDVPGIKGIDTRALTKILRESGTMNGMITTTEYIDKTEILEKIKKYRVEHVVRKVSCTQKYELKHTEGNRIKRVALMDFGLKMNIPASLAKRGCDVTIYPANVSAKEIIDCNYDGIMLSNGPGDPKECQSIIKELKELFDSGVPIFAICLGHQLMALANGGDTKKMKYGHRGANHPVKDLKTGRVYISTQNHGYVVDEESLDRSKVEVSFHNVNDNSVEGLHYLGKNIFTVQFHPEACAGPTDTAYLFDEFINMMEVSKNA